MSPSANFRNQLLNTLLPEDLALLTPLFEPVKLEVRALLEPMDAPVEHVVFVEGGVTSVVAKSPRNQQIEVGMIGRDGMSGLAVLLGDDRSANETFVQVAGDGLRVGTKALLQAMAQSTTLHPALLRFAHTFAIQISHTALANGHFKLEGRLARWLLMVHDRIDGTGWS